MAERAGDWMAQAKRDLANARYNRQGQFFEWACFRAAQQAAEKALKAVYQRMGGDAWGHSVLRLLQGLSDRVEMPEALLAGAVELDRCCIPARYPNGWSAGAPMEMFTRKGADRAIDRAEEILRFCDRLVVRP